MHAIENKNLPLEVTVLRPDRLRLLLHQQLRRPNVEAKYLLNWLSAIGDGETIRLLEQRCAEPGLQSDAVVRLQEACGYIRSRLALPEQQRSAAMRDETIYLQTYYGRVIGASRNEALASAAIFTVRDGLKLSPEWIQHTYHGLRPSFSASGDADKLLAYFIVAQRETSLTYILDEMIDVGDVAKYGRSRWISLRDLTKHSVRRANSKRPLMLSLARSRWNRKREPPC
jgi:hypothetical protein